jgi:aldehyde dehydrogenase (NAD+)
VEEGITTGARFLLEGGALEVDTLPGGTFVRPAILTGDPANVCAQQEIFGPIAYAIPFSDEEEAVRLSNDTPYGLANAVWTDDQNVAERVTRDLSSGTVWVNTQLQFAPGVRYGGWHQSGLGGGVLAPDALTDYLRPKAVVRGA